MYRLGIVEDEELILRGLRNYYPWEKLGFTISVLCHNGKELLEYLSNGNMLDAILSDIAMPEMDGIEMAQIISAEYPSIQMVFISGHADFSYAQQAIRFNVSEYLLKPVKYNDLINAFTNIRNKIEEQSGLKPRISSNNQLIQRIHDITESNLSSVTWKGIADELNFTPTYLSALYKKLEGRSFSDYLLETKMNAAHDMLLETNLRTYEIAEKLGYSNPKNFSRAFRLYFGKSPKEFRDDD